jgi:hypothetical protein
VGETAFRGSIWSFGVLALLGLLVSQCDSGTPSQGGAEDAAAAQPDSASAADVGQAKPDATPAKDASEATDVTRGEAGDGSPDASVVDAESDVGPEAGSDAGARPEAGGDGDAGHEAGGDAAVNPGKPASTSCGRGWCWLSPLPQGNDLYAVWTTAKNEVWAVGDSATMLHHDGREWRFVETTATAALSSVSGTGATDIWVTTGYPDTTFGGTDGTPPLRHWDGVRWTAVPLPVSGDCSRIVSASASDAVTVCGGVVVRWDGLEWKVMPGAPSTSWVASYEPGDLWTVRAAGAVHHWNGSSWQEFNAPVMRNLFAYGAGRFAALEDEGNGDTDCEQVWLFDRGTWKALPVFSPGSYRCGIWADSENDIWVSSLLHWDGQSWAAKPTPANYGTTMVTGFGGTSSDLWAVGQGGLILHYDGVSWQQHSTTPVLIDTRDSLGFENFDVWASAPNDLWVAGGRSTLHFDGTTWRSVPTGLTEGVLGAIWGASSNDVWAGGYREECIDDEWYGWDCHDVPIVIRWDGSSWKTVATPVSTCRISDIGGTSASDVWFTSWNGCRTWRYDGQAFRIQDSIAPGTSALWKIAGDGPSGLWGLAGGTKVLRRAPGSASWVAYELPIGDLQSIWAANSGDAWVSGYTGFAHFDGSEWSALFSPIGGPGVVAGTGPGDAWAFHRLMHRAIHSKGNGDFSTIVPGPYGMYGFEAYVRPGVGAWLINGRQLLFRAAGSAPPAPVLK